MGSICGTEQRDVDRSGAPREEKKAPQTNNSVPDQYQHKGRRLPEDRADVDDGPATTQNTKPSVVEANEPAGADATASGSPKELTTGTAEGKAVTEDASSLSIRVTYPQAPLTADAHATINIDVAAHASNGLIQGGLEAAVCAESSATTAPVETAEHPPEEQSGAPYNPLLPRPTHEKRHKAEPHTGPIEHEREAKELEKASQQQLPQRPPAAAKPSKATLTKVEMINGESKKEPKQPLVEARFALQALFAEQHDALLQEETAAWAALQGLHTKTVSELAEARRPETESRELTVEYPSTLPPLIPPNRHQSGSCTTLPNGNGRATAAYRPTFVESYDGQCNSGDNDDSTHFGQQGSPSAISSSMPANRSASSSQINHQAFASSIDGAGVTSPSGPRKKSFSRRRKSSNTDTIADEPFAAQELVLISSDSLCNNKQPASSRPPSASRSMSPVVSTLQHNGTNVYYCQPNTLATELQSVRINLYYTVAELLLEAAAAGDAHMIRSLVSKYCKSFNPVSPFASNSQLGPVGTASNAFKSPASSSLMAAPLHYNSLDRNPITTDMIASNATALFHSSGVPVTMPNGNGSSIISDSSITSPASQHFLSPTSASPTTVAGPNGKIWGVRLTKAQLVSLRRSQTTPVVIPVMVPYSAPPHATTLLPSSCQGPTPLVRPKLTPSDANDKPHPLSGFQTPPRRTDSFRNRKESLRKPLCSSLNTTTTAFAPRESNNRTSIANESSPASNIATEGEAIPMALTKDALLAHSMLCIMKSDDTLAGNLKHNENHYLPREGDNERMTSKLAPTSRRSRDRGTGGEAALPLDISSSSDGDSIATGDTVSDEGTLTRDPSNNQSATLNPASDEASQAENGALSLPPKASSSAAAPASGLVNSFSYRLPPLPPPPLPGPYLFLPLDRVADGPFHQACRAGSVEALDTLIRLNGGSTITGAANAAASASASLMNSLNNGEPGGGLQPDFPPPAPSIPSALPVPPFNYHSGINEIIQGRTPLHEAIIGGHVNLVLLLLDDYYSREELVGAATGYDGERRGQAEKITIGGRRSIGYCADVVYPGCVLVPASRVLQRAVMEKQRAIAWLAHAATVGASAAGSPPLTTVLFVDAPNHSRAGRDDPAGGPSGPGSRRTSFAAGGGPDDSQQGRLLPPQQLLFICDECLALHANNVGFGLDPYLGGSPSEIIALTACSQQPSNAGNPSRPSSAMSRTSNRDQSQHIARQSIAVASEVQEVVRRTMLEKVLGATSGLAAVQVTQASASLAALRAGTDAPLRGTGTAGLNGTTIGPFGPTEAVEDIMTDEMLFTLINEYRSGQAPSIQGASMYDPLMPALCPFCCVEEQPLTTAIRCGQYSIAAIILKRMLQLVLVNTDLTSHPRGGVSAAKKARKGSVAAHFGGSMAGPVQQWDRLFYEELVRAGPRALISAAGDGESYLGALYAAIITKNDMKRMLAALPSAALSANGALASVVSGGAQHGAGGIVEPHPALVLLRQMTNIRRFRDGFTAAHVAAAISDGSGGALPHQLFGGSVNTIPPAAGLTRQGSLLPGFAGGGPLSGAAPTNNNSISNLAQAASLAMMVPAPMENNNPTPPTEVLTMLFHCLVDAGARVIPAHVTCFTPPPPLQAMNGLATRNTSVGSITYALIARAAALACSEGCRDSAVMERTSKVWLPPRTQPSGNNGSARAGGKALSPYLWLSSAMTASAPDIIRLSILITNCQGLPLSLLFDPEAVHALLDDSTGYRKLSQGGSYVGYTSNINSRLFQLNGTQLPVVRTSQGLCFPSRLLRLLALSLCSPLANSCFNLGRRASMSSCDALNSHEIDLSNTTSDHALIANTENSSIANAANTSQNSVVSCGNTSLNTGNGNAQPVLQYPPRRPVATDAGLTTFYSVGISPAEVAQLCRHNKNSQHIKMAVAAGGAVSFLSSPGPGSGASLTLEDLRTYYFAVAKSHYSIPNSLTSTPGGSAALVAGVKGKIQPKKHEGAAVCHNSEFSSLEELLRANRVRTEKYASNAGALNHYSNAVGNRHAGATTISTTSTASGSRAGSKICLVTGHGRTGSTVSSGGWQPPLGPIA